MNLYIKLNNIPPFLSPPPPGKKKTSIVDLMLDYDSVLSVSVSCMVLVFCIIVLLLNSN